MYGKPGLISNEIQRKLYLDSAHCVERLPSPLEKKNNHSRADMSTYNDVNSPEEETLTKEMVTNSLLALGRHPLSQQYTYLESALAVSYALITT